MPAPSAFHRPTAGQLQTLDRGDRLERRIAELAQGQHGVVGRTQLSALGATRDEIDWRVSVGSLHVIHRGVYAVGHTAITRRGRWMATVLASGDGAVLSHRSATALWGIWGNGVGEVHVTVPRKVRSQGPIHRHYSLLPRDETAVVAGIPVTSAARAVLDLAGEQGEAAAEAALREMEYLGIYGEVSLPALLARHPRHRGTAAVRFALERLGDDLGGRIRSPLEESFLPFLDAHGIPRPRLNAWLTIGDQRFQADCLWPDARLIGELDGFQSHGTSRAFHGDRSRDRRLSAAGFRVVRLTKSQLVQEAHDVATDLRTLLAPTR